MNEHLLEDMFSPMDTVFKRPEAPSADDVVVKPAHYEQYLIEPVTFVMENKMEFWRGNIIKYASRAGSKTYDGKDAVDSEVTDLRKVIRYAEMRINMLTGKSVTAT